MRGSAGRANVAGLHARPEDEMWELEGEKGKFKVMTLRNIGMTAPYAHNGLFETLEDITNFYNTRDVDGCPHSAVEVDV